MEGLQKETNRRIFYAIYGEFDNLLTPIKLKPLSKISDEDAVGIPSIPNRTTLELLDYFCKKDHLVACEYLLGSLTPQDYDYLRSRGYALPWMGISVEKMIEAGWIKLEEL
jgi:hypothetical protein